MGVFSFMELFPVIIALAIIVLVVPIIALIDILKSNFEGNNKIVWVIVILLLWIIGAVLHFYIGRKQKIPN
jgi:hypothetical protein